MSLIKSNTLQLGQSLTATNNFCWYQPSTPDGTVRLGNGNAGSVTDLVTVNSSGNVGIGTSSPTGISGYTALTLGGSSSKGLLTFRSSSASDSGYLYHTGSSIELAALSTTPLNLTTSNANLTLGTVGTTRVTLDQSGNLGLGVTPSGWDSTYKAMQISRTSLSGVGTAGVFANNVYYSGGWKRIAATAAGSYVIDANTHAWNIAASGSADSAISFTQAMTLDASGNLLVGATSNSGVRLYVKGASATNADWSIYAVNSAGTTQFGLRNDNYLYAPSVGGYGTTGTTVVVNGNYLGYLSSSLRFKKDIVDYDKGLNEILMLRPVYYKSSVQNPDGGYDEQRYAGLIAEEIAELGFSEFVLNGPDDQINSIQYGNMVAICVKAIQELSAELNELKGKIA